MFINLKININGKPIEYEKYINTEFSEKTITTIAGSRFEVTLIVWAEAIKEKFCCYFFYFIKIFIWINKHSFPPLVNTSILYYQLCYVLSIVFLLNYFIYCFFTNNLVFYKHKKQEIVLKLQLISCFLFNILLLTFNIEDFFILLTKSMLSNCNCHWSRPNPFISSNIFFFIFLLTYIDIISLYTLFLISFYIFIHFHYK